MIDDVEVKDTILPDGTHQKLVIVVRNTNEVHDESMTYGDRLADKVAQWGGSWYFIICASIFLSIWTIGNVVLSFMSTKYAFDPYPFIFLNLILSMIAALQAPIIMMSQNRQSKKDRTAAQLDYEVNCKAAENIVALHQKMDNEIVGLKTKLEELTTYIQRKQ